MGSGFRDIWGRFFFVPKGQKRTVPKCPKTKKELSFVESSFCLLNYSAVSSVSGAS